MINDDAERDEACSSSIGQVKPIIKFASISLCPERPRSVYRIWWESLILICDSGACSHIVYTVDHLLVGGIFIYITKLREKRRIEGSVVILRVCLGFCTSLEPALVDTMLVLQPTQRGVSMITTQVRGREWQLIKVLSH